MSKLKGNKLQQTFQKILDYADIKIDGDNPWDIKIHNKEFYRRVFAHASLGLGESYMDGWWDCDRLDEFYYKILNAQLQEKVRGRDVFISVLKAKLFNLQKKARAFEIGKRHYDLGNKLYTYMLDKRMIYSCGYWKNSDNLDDAQESKLDLTCRKLNLKSGMKILDIGCGWGGFANYAATNFDVSVVGVTVSKEQVVFAKELCQGLPVEIRFQDYRDVNEKFDAIVSIGMFEHVGLKNYRTYMRTVDRCLEDGGLFLLHTIGSDRSLTYPDPWSAKYIFPNSITPSAKQVTNAAEGLFTLEDWHNFGPDYDKTAMAWHQNFEKNWDKIKNDYDNRFKRMWDHFLLRGAGSSRARHNHLWQIVFSKKGFEGRYHSVR
ncbi:MAG: cyclopropane fatty acyl phospholipid synthase [candidate division Zixibacteria bacterium]|nr:cyclopropane fatty acyl phospholipid synthase [candidate division Zixibacteria bacterium]